MSLVGVAIPGIVGLVLLLWPQSMFIGARVSPHAAKLRLLRIVGMLLLLVIAIFLVVDILSA